MATDADDEAAGQDPGTAGHVPAADNPFPELRTWVRRELSDVAADRVDDAVMVLDELATNAHRHGGGMRALRLRRLARGRCLRVEVDDHTRARPVITRSPGGTGGYGLHLVDAVATAWGARLHPWGKTVWAEMSLEP